MARKQGSGFKMKRGPMKDLGSFFSSFGKQLKRGQAERGIFSEKGKAEAKEARKPKWKREHDTRKKEERKRFEEKEIDRILKTDKSWGEVEDTPEVVKESSGYVPQEFKGEAGDKFRYRKTGEYTEGDDTYAKYEFMDPNRPGEWIPAGKNKKGGWKGFGKIQDLYEKRFAAGELFDSPVDKKSPYKKSGFKMKSSPVKIYNKAGKRRKNYKY